MKRMIVAAEEDEFYVTDTSDAIKNAWFKALQSCDLEEEDVHVLSYEEVKQFKKVLIRELSNRHVNLSGKTLTIEQHGDGTQIEGLSVGGNEDAIADRLVRGVTKKAWGDPTPKEYWQDTIEGAADHDDQIYLQDKFGYCDPISPKKAMQIIGLGDQTQYSGHGSQSYIDDIKVTLYEDYFGSVKIARTVSRWD